MSIIDTVEIDNTKIKFRFSEPYASEASNIQMGVNLPGAYRGAIVEASSPASRYIYINKESGDSDSIILHRNSSDGVCTVVRETLDIELDVSSVWPISSETTLYVYMYVDYDHTPQTSGIFRVVNDIGDVDPDAVMLAHVVLPSGAANVEQEYIKTDGSKRDKVHSKRGIVVMKRADYSSTILHRTGFEITDKVCFMGSSYPRNRVRLGDGVTNIYPLTGSDGGQVLASTWYDVEGGTPLSLLEMDEDGCYTNPWITMDFDDTDDTYNTSGFSAWYYAYVPFDELNAEDRNAGFFGLHTNEIYGRDKDGSPDSLDNGVLDEQLDSLLGFINDRINEIHPTTVSSTWLLLWRSNNVATNADVTNDTFSVYFNNNGFALLRGGYMDGNNFTVPVTGETGDVSAIFIYSNDMYFAKTNVSSLPFSQSILSASGWDEYQLTDGDSGAFWHNIYSFYFYESAKVTMSATPDTGDNEKYIELLHLSDGNIRMYWGGYSDTDQNDFLICWGCYWDNASSLWRRSSSASFDARVFEIGYGDISLKVKDTTDSDYLTGWTNWSGSFGFDSRIKLYGSVPQKFIVPFKVMLTEDLVRGMRDSTYIGPRINSVVNLGLRRSISVSGPYTWTQLGSVSLDETGVVDSSTDYIHVYGDLDITNHLTELTLYPNASGNAFVAPDKINLDASVGWPQIVLGQAIGVRGDINNMWVVESISYVAGSPSRYEITVDNELALNSVPDDTDTGNSAYILKPEDAGKEVVAFYSIEFNY